MKDFLTSPGFLGTKATLRSDLTLVLILLSAALFTIGFILARRKHYTAHRWVQSVAVIVSAIVVVISMVTSYVVHILPGIPSKLGQGDYAVTSVHAVVGMISLLYGIYVALVGNDLLPKGWQFSNYRPYMRWAYVLYMLSTLGGIMVYIIVFIFGI